MNTVKIKKSGIKLPDIWFMHNHLSTAAEKMNSVYSVQLMLWIFMLCLNILSRVYYIIINRHDWGKIKELIVIVRDTVTAVGCFVHLFIIIVACHVTSHRVSGHFCFSFFLFIYSFIYLYLFVYSFIHYLLIHQFIHIFIYLLSDLFIHLFDKLI